MNQLRLIAGIFVCKFDVLRFCRGMASITPKVETKTVYVDSWAAAVIICVSEGVAWPGRDQLP